MKLILGTEKPDPEMLAIMRERIKPNAAFYAYQNHDMSSASLGHLQFLLCGEGCTYAEPPARMPDSQLGIGWRYLLCGVVNLETGAIDEVKS